MSDRIRDMLESRDDEYVERLNEIARLTAELAEAKSMLEFHVYLPVNADDVAQKLGAFIAGRSDPDEWAEADRLLNGVREVMRKLTAELAAAQERERVLREAVELAMRYLEPTTNCYQVLQSALRAALGEP